MPAYNEEVGIAAAVGSLAASDYPDFEIVVVDNNTKDPSVWQPVEAYCRDRPTVRFVLFQSGFVAERA